MSGAFASKEFFISSVTATSDVVIKSFPNDLLLWD